MFVIMLGLNSKTVALLVLTVMAWQLAYYNLKTLVGIWIVSCGYLLATVLWVFRHVTVGIN